MKIRFKNYYYIVLGIRCYDLQWEPVPDSFNLDDDPNDCIRVDKLIKAPRTTDPDFSGPVPWTISKSFQIVPKRNFLLYYFNIIFKLLLR